ncbi:MAG: prepilin-type N-terminal cleavage/methylation domain-containing protein [Kiritimatiellales bacterium]
MKKSGTEKAEQASPVRRSLGEGGRLQNNRPPALKLWRTGDGCSTLRTGFSLLEVLIALTILGIAAGGILTALGSHLKNVTFIKDHAQAVRIATREMDSLRRAPEFSEDEISGDENGFAWTAGITTEGFDEWPGIEFAAGTPAQLNITVTWDGGKVQMSGFKVFEIEE